MSPCNVLLGAALWAVLPFAVVDCTTTRSGAVVTTQIDTARIDQDGRAVAIALNGILAIPGVSEALGPANAALARASIAGIQTGIDDIDGATGGTETVTLDLTSLQSKVNAVVSEAHAVLTLVLQIAPRLPAPVNAQVVDKAQAALTLLPFVQLAVQLAAAARTQTHPMMSEQQALSVAAP